MKSLNFIIVLIHCGGIYSAPTTEPTTTPDDGANEVSIPNNMNIADYYYSIFGKHLDYDYREPLLTFDEPTQNELSDEIISEVDKGSTDPWDTHSRKKRFILVPANFYNATRRWSLQTRRLRLERRRLRTERLRQWQQNRIKYLNSRSESLQRQATRLSQLQLRQQVTRSVPEQQSSNRIVISVTTSTTTTTTAKPIATASLSDSGNNIKSTPAQVKEKADPK